MVNRAYTMKPSEMKGYLSTIKEDKLARQELEQVVKELMVHVNECNAVKAAEDADDKGIAKLPGFNFRESVEPVEGVTFSEYIKAGKTKSTK